MPMAAVERSISSTRRKFNDACCNFVRLIHQPDLGVIIEQHIAPPKWQWEPLGGPDGAHFMRDQMATVV